MCVRDVRKFKETKKHFDRVREDMELAQVKNAQAPRTKPHEVEEATSALSISRKCFRHLALDYVLQVSYKLGAETVRSFTSRKMHQCYPQIQLNVKVLQASHWCVTVGDQQLISQCHKTQNRFTAAVSMALECL